MEQECLFRCVIVPIAQFVRGARSLCVLCGLAKDVVVQTNLTRDGMGVSRLLLCRATRLPGQAFHLALWHGASREDKNRG